MTRKDTAFTLIEMIVVIAIIGLLAAMLLPAVSAARERARRVTAKTEVKQLEIAWKSYYSEYQRWPTNVLKGINYEETAVPIIGDVVKLLSDPSGDPIGNPKGLTFFKFKKMNVNGDPTNPWAIEETSTDPVDYYYVKFDRNFDNKIMKSKTSGPPTNDVKREVIVWTINPREPEDSSESVVGSWN